MAWKCGFKFFDKSDPDWATKPYIWRRCDRPWIHLLLPNLKHSGPIIPTHVIYGTRIHDQLKQYYRDTPPDEG